MRLVPDSLGQAGRNARSKLEAAAKADTPQEAIALSNEAVVEMLWELAMQTHEMRIELERFRYTR